MILRAAMYPTFLCHQGLLICCESVVSMSCQADQPVSIERQQYYVIVILFVLAWEQLCQCIINDNKTNKQLNA